MPHVFRCKQFVWVGNVSKTSCKWFERVEDLSQFKENFKRIMMKTVIRDIFLK